ncbi:MAG: ankyrin repeat domain-containing protein [Micavibrio sp.]|nr:ankyrin repeat domain-containing protein [Micavibrio sp.]
MTYNDPDALRDVFKTVETGNMANLRFYLTDGLDPDLKDPQTGLTLLHRAINDNQLEAAQLLLDAGADPNIHGGPSYYTAIHFAVYKDNAAALNLLLHPKYAANMEASNNDGQTALHMTGWFGRQPLAELLLRHGADAGASDRRGKTPVDVADARAQEFLDFAQQEFLLTARFLRQALLEKTGAEVTAAAQRDKLGNDLDALKKLNPQRFRLKP